jgi:hypothetical protein
MDFGFIKCEAGHATIVARSYSRRRCTFSTALTANMEFFTILGAMVHPFC